MFTEELQGLGVTVTVTPSKSPAEMAAREQYWFNVYLKEIVNGMAQQYRDAGFAGLSGIFSMFGKKKKPEIPWGEIYAQATPVARQYAHDMTVNEEQNRQQAEVQQVAQIRQETGERRSVEASTFKMPEGVTSISRGALVISPVGQAIIRKK
jgi:hypothetical protein